MKKTAYRSDRAVRLYCPIVQALAPCRNAVGCRAVAGLVPRALFIGCADYTSDHADSQEIIAEEIVPIRSRVISAGVQVYAGRFYKHPYIVLFCFCYIKVYTMTCTDLHTF